MSSFLTQSASTGTSSCGGTLAIAGRAEHSRGSRRTVTVVRPRRPRGRVAPRRAYIIPVRYGTGVPQVHPVRVLPLCRSEQEEQEKKTSECPSTAPVRVQRRPEVFASRYALPFWAMIAVTRLGVAKRCGTPSGTVCVVFHGLSRHSMMGSTVRRGGCSGEGIGKECAYGSRRCRLRTWPR
jgi:hypothetical protein